MGKIKKLAYRKKELRNRNWLGKNYILYRHASILKKI